MDYVVIPKRIITLLINIINIINNYKIKIYGRRSINSKKNKITKISSWGLYILEEKINIFKCEHYSLGLIRWNIINSFQKVLIIFNLTSPISIESWASSRFDSESF